MTRLPTTRAVVALTFDAGSDAGSASAILDTLAANGIHASFGITGAWARANPGLIARIVRDGHQVINHTDDHRSFTGYSTNTAALSAAQRANELKGAEAAIMAAGGKTSKPWFRPPYGDRDASVDRDAAANGYSLMAMWTVDSLGWKGASVDTIVSRCLSGAAPGTIYLFHVGSQSTDALALSKVIAGLQARGYGFVTLAQGMS